MNPIFAVSKLEVYRFVWDTELKHYNNRFPGVRPKP